MDSSSPFIFTLLLALRSIQTIDCLNIITMQDMGVIAHGRLYIAVSCQL